MSIVHADYKENCLLKVLSLQAEPDFMKRPYLVSRMQHLDNFVKTQKIEPDVKGIRLIENV